MIVVCLTQVLQCEDRQRVFQAESHLPATSVLLSVGIQRDNYYARWLSTSPLTFADMSTRIHDVAKLLSLPFKVVLKSPVRNCFNRTAGYGAWQFHVGDNAWRSARLDCRYS